MGGERGADRSQIYSVGRGIPMATAPDLMAEPTKTRVWRDLTVKRSDAKGNPIDPPWTSA